MRGFFTFTVRILYEIIVLIIILILLVYAVQSIGLLSSFEDRKYIALVKFIENALKPSEVGKVETWRDYITYNPVKYSILFNYTDKRIYLYKCDSPELKVTFYNVTDNLWAKDLIETNCYPIYISEGVLNDRVIVNISGGVIVKEGGTETLVLKLYDLSYSDSAECYYTEAGEFCIPALVINNIYNNVIITYESKITDVSSYFFGLSSSIRKEDIISRDCINVKGYKKCVIDTKQLLKDGKLVMPKLTVSVNKTGSNTIISFKTTI